PQLGSNDVRVSANHHKHAVKIVRHSGRKPADRIQPLSVGNGFFKLPSRLFRPLLLGYISAHGCPADVHSVPILEIKPRAMHPDGLGFSEIAEPNFGLAVPFPLDAWQKLVKNK